MPFLANLFLFAAAEPSQRVNGHIAAIASPPDVRYAPLAPLPDGKRRTFDGVRALVFPVGDAGAVEVWGPEATVQLSIGFRWALVRSRLDDRMHLRRLQAQVTCRPSHFVVSVHVAAACPVARALSLAPAGAAAVEVCRRCAW